jgi:HAD superfamily hydrolase (TIGR01509 family)
MKKIKIKAIIFDLGGVIAHGGYLDFLKHYCAECVTPLGRKKILALERQVNLGKINQLEFYRGLQRVFHVHLTPKQMHDLIVKNMKANKKLVHLIPRLKKVKVALFTNSLGMMAYEVLRQQHLTGRNLFDKVFVSTKMHEVKPDQKAYRDVLKRMKTKPQEALLVDDRMDNIRPARKIGMNGILFKSTAQFQKELKKYEIA